MQGAESKHRDAIDIGSAMGGMAAGAALSKIGRKEMIAWSDWSTVERWSDMDPGTREDDYRSFEARGEETMFAPFQVYLRELAERLVFRNLSTPDGGGLIVARGS
jgi:hypothetical protein